MKELRIFLAMLFMVGTPCPLISESYFQGEHSVLFAPLSILSAFIGTAMIFGLKGFKQRPVHIGNVGDDTMPIINQNWAVFFITCICNLLMANLTGV